MPHSAITAFLDTNSLLHYPPIKDVDWCTVCDAASVKLVLCMQVIHELDEKKSDLRLASRAERIIKEIKAIDTTGGAVRDNITPEVFNHELRASDFPGSLSPDSKDDRIVHLVMQYINTHTDQVVVVLTEDMGMSLRCKAHSIGVVEPDTERRLESPQSELDKKYKAAINELNELKKRHPSIELRVVPSSKSEDDIAPFTAILKRELTLPNMNDLVESRRSELIHHTQPPATSLLIGSTFISDFGLPPPEERTRYASELSVYLDQYRRWLEDAQGYLDLESRMFSFHVCFANVGQCPATDVRARLKLPPVFAFIEAGDNSVGSVPHLLPEPPYPEPPRSLLSKIKSSIRDPYSPSLSVERFKNLQMLKPQTLHPHPACELGGSVEGGLVISFEVPKLIHYANTRFGPFTVMFNQWPDVKPFQAHSLMTAAELPKRVEINIPFIIKVEE